MTADSISIAPNKGQPLGSPISWSKPLYLLLALRRAGATTLANIKAGVKALQTARMMAVLSEMSDVQLTQIGISRSEIPEYAKSMMAEDGNTV